MRIGIKNVYTFFLTMGVVLGAVIFCAYIFTSNFLFVPKSSIASAHSDVNLGRLPKSTHEIAGKKPRAIHSNDGEYSNIRKEFDGILSDIYSLQISNNKTEFKNLTAQLLVAAMKYPEPFRSLIQDHLADRFVNWARNEQQLSIDDSLDYVKIMIENLHGQQEYANRLELSCLRKFSEGVDISDVNYHSFLACSQSGDSVRDRLNAIICARYCLAENISVMDSFAEVKSGKLKDCFIGEVLLQVNVTNPAEAVNLFLKVPADVTIDEELANSIIGWGVRSNPEKTSEIIAGADPSPARDKAVKQLIDNVAYTDPQRAKQWLEVIVDPSVKAAAQKSIDNPRDFGSPVQASGVSDVVFDNQKPENKTVDSSGQH